MVTTAQCHGAAQHFLACSIVHNMCLPAIAPQVLMALHLLEHLMLMVMYGAFLLLIHQ